MVLISTSTRPHVCNQRSTDTAAAPLGQAISH
jgi:hypothetical protein